MDYYEELGVRRVASVEDIHRAWRNLSRLLHPDQQQDEGLRLLAEAQMKRLNEVCAVLADPVQRLRYDRGLLGAPPAAPGRWAGLLDRWLLAAALVLCVIGAAVLYPRAAEPRMPLREPVVAATPAVPPPQPVLRHTAHRNPPAPLRHRQEPPRVDMPLIAVAPPPEVAAVRELPPAADVRPFAAPVARPAETPVNSIAGAWLYAPQKKPGSALLYPPEFIEVFIDETDGALRGRYRARYRVGDRPISGDVRFSFEGQRQGDPIVLPWTGSGGSSGAIRLKLLANGTLEVSWRATQLGASMDLASGTAILIRRREL